MIMLGREAEDNTNLKYLAIISGTCCAGPLVLISQLLATRGFDSARAESAAIKGIAWAGSYWFLRQTRREIYLAWQSASSRRWLVVFGLYLTLIVIVFFVLVSLLAILVG